MKATYADIKNYLNSFEAFRGSSLMARWQNGLYVVTSYATDIAVISPQQGKAVLNTRYYSSTTSRGQNLVRNAVKRFEIVEVDGSNELFEKVA